MSKRRMLTTIVLPGKKRKGPHLELCDIKTRLNSVHVVLVRYSERDGGRFNDLHAEAMFIRAQPIYSCSTVWVILSEVLKFAMGDIVELLQSGRE
jgi:hypothetical protein